MKGQIAHWTNQTKYSQVPGIVKNPDLPKSPDNILMIVDLFDVPEFEKAELKREMIAAAEGKIKNMIFLNDKKNI
jgi:putative ribosome biogenesis GTPase RsgA